MLGTCNTCVRVQSRVATSAITVNSYMVFFVLFCLVWFLRFLFLFFFFFFLFSVLFFFFFISRYCCFLFVCVLVFYLFIYFLLILFFFVVTARGREVCVLSSFCVFFSFPFVWGKAILFCVWVG